MKDDKQHAIRSLVQKINEAYHTKSQGVSLEKEEVMLLLDDTCEAQFGRAMKVLKDALQVSIDTSSQGTTPSASLKTYQTICALVSFSERVAMEVDEILVFLMGAKLEDEKVEWLKQKLYLSTELSGSNIASSTIQPVAFERSCGLPMKLDEETVALSVNESVSQNFLTGTDQCSFVMIPKGQGNLDHNQVAVELMMIENLSREEEEVGLMSPPANRIESSPFGKEVLLPLLRYEIFTQPGSEEVVVQNTLNIEGVGKKEKASIRSNEGDMNTNVGLEVVSTWNSSGIISEDVKPKLTDEKKSLEVTTIQSVELTDLSQQKEAGEEMPAFGVELETFSKIGGNTTESSLHEELKSYESEKPKSHTPNIGYGRSFDAHEARISCYEESVLNVEPKSENSKEKASIATSQMLPVSTDEVMATLCVDEAQNINVCLQEKANLSLESQPLLAPESESQGTFQSTKSVDRRTEKHFRPVYHNIAGEVRDHMTEEQTVETPLKSKLEFCRGLSKVVADIKNGRTISEIQAFQSYKEWEDLVMSSSLLTSGTWNIAERLLCLPKMEKQTTCICMEDIKSSRKDRNFKIFLNLIEQVGIGTEEVLALIETSDFKANDKLAEKSSMTFSEGHSSTQVREERPFSPVDTFDNEARALLKTASNFNIPDEDNSASVYVEECAAISTIVKEKIEFANAVVNLSQKISDVGTSEEVLTALLHEEFKTPQRANSYGKAMLILTEKINILAGVQEHQQLETEKEFLCDQGKSAKGMISTLSQHNMNLCEVIPLIDVEDLFSRSFSPIHERATEKSENMDNLSLDVSLTDAIDLMKDDKREIVQKEVIAPYVSENIISQVQKEERVSSYLPDANKIKKSFAKILQDVKEGIAIEDVKFDIEAGKYPELEVGESKAIMSSFMNNLLQNYDVKEDVSEELHSKLQRGQLSFATAILDIVCASDITVDDNMIDQMLEIAPEMDKMNFQDLEKTALPVNLTVSSQETVSNICWSVHRHVVKILFVKFQNLTESVTVADADDRFASIQATTHNPKFNYFKVEEAVCNEGYIQDSNVGPNVIPGNAIPALEQQNLMIGKHLLSNESTVSSMDSSRDLPAAKAKTIIVEEDMTSAEVVNPRKGFIAESGKPSKNTEVRRKFSEENTTGQSLAKYVTILQQTDDETEPIEETETQPIVILPVDIMEFQVETIGDEIAVLDSGKSSEKVSGNIKFTPTPVVTITEESPENRVRHVDEFGDRKVIVQELISQEEVNLANQGEERVTILSDEYPSAISSQASVSLQYVSALTVKKPDDVEAEDTLKELSNKLEKSLPSRVPFSCDACDIEEICVHNKMPLEGEKVERCISQVISAVLQGKTLEEVTEYYQLGHISSSKNVNIQKGLLSIVEKVCEVKGVESQTLTETSTIQPPSSEFRGLKALFSFKEKTAISCEEMFTIMKSCQMMEEEDLPDIEWFTSENTSIPEILSSMKVSESHPVEETRETKTDEEEIGQVKTTCPDPKNVAEIKKVMIVEVPRFDSEDVMVEKVKEMKNNAPQEFSNALICIAENVKKGHTITEINADIASGAIHIPKSPLALKSFAKVNLSLGSAFTTEEHVSGENADFPTTPNFDKELKIFVNAVESIPVDYELNFILSPCREEREETVPVEKANVSRQGMDERNIVASKEVVVAKDTENLSTPTSAFLNTAEEEKILVIAEGLSSIEQECQEAQVLTKEDTVEFSSSESNPAILMQTSQSLNVAEEGVYDILPNQRLKNILKSAIPTQSIESPPAVPVVEDVQSSHSVQHVDFAHIELPVKEIPVSLPRDATTVEVSNNNRAIYLCDILLSICTGFCRVMNKVYFTTPIPCIKSTLR